MTTIVPGAPVWVELYTTDTDGAKRFYGELFGWTAQDTGPEFGDYINFLHNGAPIAGCMRNDGSGGPSAWTVYLHSDDAAETVARTRSHGGEVTLEPMQVADLGTMAMVTDPAGAAVGVWQPGRHTGFAVRGETGTPAWFEVLSSDYDAAVRFYREVFGWDTYTMSDSPELRYTTLGKDDDALAGIMDARALLAGRPSYWNFYIQVDDTDAAVDKAKTMGGSEVMAPEDTPYGRLATVGDPTGVPFMLMGPGRG